MEPTRRNIPRKILLVLGGMARRLLCHARNPSPPISRNSGTRGALQRNLLLLLSTGRERVDVYQNMDISSTLSEWLRKCSMSNRVLFRPPFRVQFRPLQGAGLGVEQNPLKKPMPH